LPIGSVVSPGALVVVLSHTSPAQAQRAAIVPMLGQTPMPMPPSMQLAQPMVRMAGSPRGAPMMGGGMMGGGTMGMGGA
jgi:hypothetical protein